MVLEIQSEKPGFGLPQYTILMFFIKIQFKFAYF